MKISELFGNKDLSAVKLLEFKRTSSNAFCFVFRHDVEPGEVIIVKMPPVSANKRGINDIGWISDAELDTSNPEQPQPKIRLYGTLAENPRDGESLIQEIGANDEVNKTTSAILVKNTGEKTCRIEMRAILN